MDVATIATDTTLTGLVSSGALQIAKQAKPDISGERAYRFLLAFAGVMSGLQWAGTVWPVFAVVWAGVSAVVGGVFMANGYYESFKQQRGTDQ